MELKCIFLCFIISCICSCVSIFQCLDLENWFSETEFIQGYTGVGGVVIDQTVYKWLEKDTVRDGLHNLNVISCFDHSTNGSTLKKRKPDSV